jgi:hypothetical protein
MGDTGFSVESVDSALSQYKQQVTLSHMGLPSDPHHQTIAFGMRQMLYTLGFIDDESNHLIVESAKKKAVKMSRCSR